MKIANVLLLFLLSLQLMAGPGYLLLVGGGSEKINGWSDEPYSWALQKSANKRVAIITYDPDPGTWLPNYFKSLGAEEAKNFILDNATIADLPETYDSLVTYDVIFFKGGDQWKYYDYYQNTLTQEAVELVYQSGGVIGGTSAGLAILSGVFFSAENGTVYPEEALENPFNQYMTLKNDFLDIFPGYVFDSHFVERARFGRLLGFMGNRHIAEGEDLVGIGVDDKTALCISADSAGIVYGTGAVTFYKTTENTNFQTSGEKLLGCFIDVRQLLHNCTIDLETMEVSGLNTPVTPVYDAVDYHNQLWVSGSDKIFHNTTMLQHFATAAPVGDTIVIVTGNTTLNASIFKDYLEEELEVPVLIFQAIPANVADPGWTERINRLSKYLVLGNEYETFMDFLHSWPNGNQMKDLVLKGEKLVAFVGDNSRFAGHTVLVNYEQEYASYDGLLEFDAGWGLLRNAIIMPKTFSTDIDNENAAAGVPYGMVLNNLKMGIWLHDNCFMHYSPGTGLATMRSYGDFPMILIDNEGTMGDFSTQSAVNSGEPRDVAGFEVFRICLSDSTMSRTVALVESIPGWSENRIFYSPNPVRNKLTVTGPEGVASAIRVYDINGKVLVQEDVYLPASFSLGHLPSGIYLLEVTTSGFDKTTYSKLIKQ